MKYLKLFEMRRTKEEQKAYYRAKADAVPVEDRIMSISDLSGFDIPDGIIEKMKSWEVIVKSPYGNSFYNSKDISWTNKPDGSFRVSDHWNFVARDSKHCITTNPVKNTTHVSLGQYDKKNRRYKILLSLPSPEYLKNLEAANKKRAYLSNPEVIDKKRNFKNKISSGEISGEISNKDQIYKGIVKKFNGTQLKLEDESGNTVFDGTGKTVKFFDKDGSEIQNPYRFDSMRYIKTFESFFIY